MGKRFTAAALCIFILCMASMSFAADAKKGAPDSKFKRFWQKVFKYPANVADESARVVADTGKKGVGVVTKEVKRTGEVVTGDIGKVKEMVVEPLEGTAETAKTAVEGTIMMPIEAAKKTEEEVK